jgi:hypothetical protein
MPHQPEFNRDVFAMIVERNALTFEKIKEMLDSKQIGENDMLFTLDGVIAIAAAVYSGAWITCSKMPTPNGKWSMEIKARNTRLFIKEAY